MQLKTTRFIVIAIVLFCMWSSALGVVSCPHMSGQVCQPSDKGQAISSFSDAVGGTHATHAETNVPSQVRQPGQHTKSHCGSGKITLPSQLNNFVTSNEDMCSHCFTRSLSPLSVSFALTAQNSSTREAIEARSFAAMFESSVSLTTLKLLQDHSPPANVAPRHLLIGVFRI